MLVSTYMAMRVLVCGGRHFSNRTLMWSVMNTLHAQKPISVVIEGGASGADKLAFDWASENNRCGTETYSAEWHKYGNLAGPIRNVKMLETAHPDMVVAFPGGRGTENLIAQAKARGITVCRIEE